MPNNFEQAIDNWLDQSPELAGFILGNLTNTSLIYTGGLMEAVYWQDYIKYNQS